MLGITSRPDSRLSGPDPSGKEKDEAAVQTSFFEDESQEKKNIFIFFLFLNKIQNKNVFGESSGANQEASDPLPAPR